MPRDVLFTKDEITAAAFQVFVCEGLEAISARRIASRLKCSTAPVYTVFGSMDELKNRLIEKSLQLLLGYTQREYTPYIFLNIGVGMLEFAKDYRLVYRALFFEGNEHRHILADYSVRNLAQMKKDPTLRIFSVEQLQTILEKMTVYTHGLAALICADMYEQATLEFFIDNLRDVGGDIIGATALKAGRLEEYLADSMGGGICNEESYSS